MATSAGYRILDEPSPGALARYAVQPFWPLLSLMLGGAWVAWPWFVFNAFALGSATRARELWLCVGGLLVPAAIVLGAVASIQGGVLSEALLPYVRIAIYVAKVAFAYLVFMRQESSAMLFQYFGGVLRNGVIVALGAMFVRQAVSDLLGSGLLGVVLG